MMDDPSFLISHIRNSFITSDDTGMCEIIIENDEFDRDKRKALRQDSSIKEQGGSDFSDTELSNSYDILPDMGYGHRLRSNTAQRLERMKKDKRSQRKVKNIPWREPPVDYTGDDKSHLFEKKDLSGSDISHPEETKSNVSALSMQLEGFSNHLVNPFLEYSKFDGRACLGSTKKIDIFLTMAPQEERGYPLTVIVVSNARIQDLIGLICWQYTTENREPKLKENIETYCLHIAEDDGEVDMDFPSLDNREPVSKFGFSKLALVEKEPPPQSPNKSALVVTVIASLDNREPVSKFGFSKLALVEKEPPPQSPNKSALVVTVFVPNRGFNKFQVASMNTTVGEIMQRVIKRRKIKLRPGQQYNLEKQSEPGTTLDLDTTLVSLDTMEFCLIRENSIRGEREDSEEGDTSTMAASLTSHQYRSYMVSMVHKLRANTDVQLGISGEKIEIDPVATKGSVKFLRQKPTTHDLDSIASCDKIEDKSSGKSLFSLTYVSDKDQYKHLEFEAESDVAKEIIRKVNSILELRLSPVRKEYVAIKERKMLKKQESLRFS
ncbi:hypothetical protein FSP39_001919 [Pinctada imbricata]|uniref:Target of rapamycin complex 2 subunit MAPKAP1 n=1 Tax=Pinctada imbricata TaxID=66713 RepID=A0AA89BY85_PINIB|nr:hypothetical protein FSP39_001919 [Pinctada imbricata]